MRRRRKGQNLTTMDSVHIISQSVHIIMTALMISPSKNCSCLLLESGCILQRTAMKRALDYVPLFFSCIHISDPRSLSARRNRSKICKGIFSANDVSYGLSWCIRKEHVRLWLSVIEQNFNLVVDWNPAGDGLIVLWLVCVDHADVSGLLTFVIKFHVCCRWFFSIMYLLMEVA